MDDGDYNLPQPHMMRLAMEQRKEIAAHDKKVEEGMIARARKQYLHMLDRGDATWEAIIFLSELTGKSEAWVKKVILEGLPFSEGIDEELKKYSRGGFGNGKSGKKSSRTSWGGNFLPRKNKKA